jgi:glycogen debranching enzyme
VIKSGDLFLVCGRDGQVPISGNHGMGLYYHDCRFLCGFELLVAGEQPQSLAATASPGDRALVELTNRDIRTADGSLIAKESLGLTLVREVAGETSAMYDELTIERRAMGTGDIDVELAFASRFDDVFAVRGAWGERLGRYQPPRWRDGALRFRYRGLDGIERTTELRFDPVPDERSEYRCRYRLHLMHGDPVVLRVSYAVGERPLAKRRRPPPRPFTEDAMELLPEAAGTPSTPLLPLDIQYRVSDRERSDSDWLGDALAFETESELLDRTLRRALLDLRLLRSSIGDQTYLAAGVPWYVALFGRDSLIAAIQIHAFDERLCAATLALLARLQGRRDDPWREEEPGRVLHELRVGELARVGHVPHTPYYGSVDATPLFLLALVQHAHWTGRLELFHHLRTCIDAALAWIRRSCTENGLSPYLAYRRRSERGLWNQGWKDSADAIVNADGTRAEPPIALIEVQGYVYAALRGVADLLRRADEPDMAAELEAEADRLREAVERDFWMADVDTYALALQGDRRPCAVRSSNPGQLLWSGLPSEDRAARVAGTLVADDLSSGWGVRTLSSRELRYNPIGYHLGTVWPHDNSIIVAGLRRYHLDAEAERIGSDLLGAAADFEHYRMPEAFAGFSRDAYGVPVRYPVACHPQAWASGAVVHVVTELAGLRPDGFGRRLVVERPRLPSFVDRLDLRGIRLAGARIDLRLARTPDGSVTATPLEVAGDVEVEVVPSPP